MKNETEANMKANISKANKREPAVHRTALGRIGSVSGAALPVLIIGGLLYAALFVTPHAQGISTEPPVIENRDIFYGVAVPAPDTVWAAGNQGKIVRSSDGGKSWSRQTTGVSSHLHSIAAWDVARAVAVGDRGAIVVTADGGKTWKKPGIPQDAGSGKLLRTRSYADGKAWAVGEMGAALFSSDFGTNWRSVAGGEDVAWNDVAFVKDAGWLVGEFGRLQVTRDGGKSWRTVTGPVKSSLNSIYFRNESEGVAVGTEGVMLHTRDGGTNWVALPKLVEQHLFDVLWDGSQWIAVGDKGTLLTASGSGDKWSVQPEAAGTTWHTQIAGSNGRYMLAGFGVSSIVIAQGDTSKTGVIK